MNTLSRSDIESTIRMKAEPGAQYGRMELMVPAYERAFDVDIWVAEGQPAISDKTVATLNDIAHMTQETRERIRGFLYEDAMRTSREVAFGAPYPSSKPRSSGLLNLLFPQPEKYKFLALDCEDPRHPCYFVNGAADVEQKIQWVGIRINENEDVENRFALIDCYPAWEEEHGVTIILRNGEVMGVGSYDADLAEYDT